MEFGLYKDGTLRRLTERRMVLNGGGWDVYLERLGDDTEELEALYEDVLIGVTGFFRNPDAWERLGAELPALTAKTRWYGTHRVHAHCLADGHVGTVRKGKVARSNRCVHVR